MTGECEEGGGVGCVCVGGALLQHVVVVFRVSFLPFLVLEN